MPVIDSPDIYGYTVFCEDIRSETSGTRSMIGVYFGQMFVHGAFPIALPKFAFHVVLFQRKRIFRAALELRIFLPGDVEESGKASIQGSITEGGSGAAAAKTQAKDDEYVAMGGDFLLTNLVIKEAGLIKVRIAIGDNIYRLGTLKIAIASESAPPAVPVDV